jgi:zinc/manganese transport system ATP-binding protein
MVGAAAALAQSASTIYGRYNITDLIIMPVFRRADLHMPPAMPAVQARTRAAALELVDAAFGYDGRAMVTGLTGAFAPSRLTAVVGLNGSGKSTLIKGLAGELAPLRGEAVRPSREQIAYLPQRSQLDPSFPITVGGALQLSLPRRKARPRQSAQACVTQALSGVGLAGFARRPLETLSGGELQRVLFARLTLQDAQVILLDEPFSAIDARTTAELLRVLAGWAAEGRTVVAALHDLDQVREHFPDTLLLAHAPVAWGPTAAVLGPAALRQARDASEGWEAATSMGAGAS